MNIYLHGIETATPPYAYAQDYAKHRMQGWLTTPRAKRLAGAIYDRSGIDTRYSVLPDFTPDAESLLFTESADGSLHEPSTEARNRVFAEASRSLSIRCARQLVDRLPDHAAQDITHVITLSCTGFYNPGPDFDLMRGLSLNPNVERYHLGFMGCYAALPALKMAHQFCRANPEAVVLILSVELCSLHLQVSDEPDALLANALFADGAAATVVSTRTPPPHRPALCLDQFQSTLLPEGNGDMAWEIGDRGFNIRLSTYVPDIIGAHVPEIASGLLERSRLTPDAVHEWAIHPGAGPSWTNWNPLSICGRNNCRPHATSSGVMAT